MSTESVRKVCKLCFQKLSSMLTSLRTIDVVLGSVFYIYLILSALML